MEVLSLHTVVLPGEGSGSSCKVRGEVFSACVRPAMLYGCETWAPNASNLQRLSRNYRAMIRWICGVKPDDEILLSCKS